MRSLWKALTEFQAIELGPVSLVANVRPSTVVSFVERLDPQRWSVQAHAGNGIVRAHALGEWDLERRSRSGPAVASRGRLGRREPDPVPLSD